jgi:hypothetical protein
LSDTAAGVADGARIARLAAVRDDDAARIQEGPMQGPDRLMELCRGGRMRWSGEGWLAELDEVVDALARDGFQECKREVARNPTSHAPTGGVWQGLNAQTGAVASAIWVRGDERSLVFIEIDGRRVDET